MISRLFADVQKLLQTSMFALADYCGRSRGSVPIGVYFKPFSAVIASVRTANFRERRSHRSSEKKGPRIFNPSC
jgi:hypothetical protein